MSEFSDRMAAPGRRIFTNRNLRMESIEAIGFDMDHTLAVYNTENFNHLCFDLALERLISDHGYEASIRTVRWDPDAVIRGLIVDKQEGNLLKLDAYNHVTRARRGFRFLEKDEIRQAYSSGDVRLSGQRYRIFDTLFDMPEGCIFSGLMDLKENGIACADRSADQIYSEIRKTVDTMHADGTLKARIMADLGRFFIPDPDLVAVLKKFRKAGKKLFLLTNSEADYTAAVMDFLVGGDSGSWEDLFDLIICFACKPGYFLPKGEAEPHEPNTLELLPNRKGQCYVGGDCFFLEKQLGTGGDQILYFGDHTYGDILRSKKSVGWRTAMIVPEVEQEVQNLRPLRNDWRELATVEEDLDTMVVRRDRLESTEKPDQKELLELQAAIGEALGQRSVLQKNLKAAYNPYWDSLFREGRASSRFGRQTTEFACIYTSRVSNFLNYPADKFFGRHLEVLPHERWALSE
ncbi:MAG: HAD-IG family 5'-nucleotidase [bacterium]|nr:HAD-IG family 5'-nucleotidase [bacterium]